jgi:hypothetical protein
VFTHFIAFLVAAVSSADQEVEFVHPLDGERLGCYHLPDLRHKQEVLWRLQVAVYSHEATKRPFGVVRAAVAMVEVCASHVCSNGVINQGTVQVFVRDKGRVPTIELQLSFPSLLCSQGRKVHRCWLSPEVNLCVVRIILLANPNGLQPVGGWPQLRVLRD